nr:hypothetical protein [Tanacetum cinerariifolium]
VGDGNGDHACSWERPEDMNTPVLDQ